MVRLGLALVTALALAGCGADELSMAEACAEVREPVEDAMTAGDVGRAAGVLRDVAERGDAEVERVFGDAADAADHVAEHGNEDGAPAWVTVAFGHLDEACGENPGD